MKEMKMNREREREIERDELIRARGLTQMEMLEWDRDLLRCPKAHLSDVWDVWERSVYRWRKSAQQEPDPALRARMLRAADLSEARVATMIEMTWEWFKLTGKVAPDGTA
jgi:hypothetical protein